MSEPLGIIRNLGFDADGHERRERLEAIAECGGCGSKVELRSETEEWRQGRDGRWRHSSYGPAQGICEACSLLYVASWDGCQCYKLKPSEEPS